MRDVTFIIPLRSKRTCMDWSAVSDACSGTLASIANQKSKNFRSILVCHEVPDVVPANAFTEVICVETPVPERPEEFKRDKNEKIRLGIRAYLSDPTELYMVVDADDRISDNLTTYLGSHQASTFLVDKGYVYNGGAWLRAHRGTFDKLCGSVSVSNRRDAADGNIPLFLGHQNIGKLLGRSGQPPVLVPFFAVIKNVAYGENITETKFLWSDNVLRTVRKAAMMRPATPRIRRAFALDTNPA